MKTLSLFFIISLGIISIYFLGSSITGYIVSETCCFPPNCHHENQCKFGESLSSSSSLYKSILGGTALLVISALLYGLWYQKKNINRNSSVRKK